MNTRRALAFIFCTVALDVLALGVMIPVLPTIVLGFMGGDTAGAAEMFGVFATVWALMQFLCSPCSGHSRTATAGDRSSSSPAWGSGSTMYSWLWRRRSPCCWSAA